MKRAMLSLIRPVHWVKNLLIFVPPVFAGILGSVPATDAALGFLSWSAVASAVYAVNDSRDAVHDRVHGWKAKRPVARGTLGTKHAVALAVVFALSGFGLAGLVDPFFFALIVGYFVASLLYVFVVRNMRYVDVLFGGGFHALRVLAGYTWVPEALSPWLMSVAVFFFVSLAGFKRAYDISCGETGRPYDANSHQVLLRSSVGLWVLSSAIVVAYALTPVAALRYERPFLIILQAGLHLLALVRMIRIYKAAARKEFLIVLLRDPVLWILFILAAAPVVVG